MHIKGLYELSSDDVGSTLSINFDSCYMSMIILKNPANRTSLEFLSVHVCSDMLTLQVSFNSHANSITCVVDVEAEEAIEPLDLGASFVSFV